MRFRGARLFRLMVFVVLLFVLTTLSASAFDLSGRRTPNKAEHTTFEAGGVDDDPNFVSNALYDSAVEATHIGDFSRAIRLLTKVIEMRPDFAEAYRERGWARLGQGAATERIERCNRAVSGNPSSADKRIERGNAYFGAGNYDAALADFDEAATLRPDDPQPFLLRSRVYSSRGERERARKEWEIYLRKARAMDKKDETPPAREPHNLVTRA